MIRVSNIFQIIVVAFSIAIITGSCSRTVNNYEDEKAMVADAKTRIKTITVQDFKKILDSEGNYVLVDCREPGEYGIACIPGAINVPRGLLEFQIGNKVERRAKVYIYCKTGGRSALSADALSLLKYSDVTSIEGGWDAWVKEYPDDIEEEPSTGSGQPAEQPQESGGGCGG